MSGSIDFPVIIVGAGPVGLALAADLGLRGIRCLVCERSDGTILQPRMDLVGVRTMEFCRRWGIADRVRRSPFPRDVAQDFVYCTSVTGHELARRVMPSLDAAVAPFWSPETSERCPQDMFDPILRRFCASLATVSLSFETEVVGLRPAADFVDVDCEGRDGRTTYRAAFVVGCDGVGSTVRRTLGIGMQGNPCLTHSLNILFRSPGLAGIHDKGSAYRFVLIDEGGIWATLVRIDGRDTYRLQVVGGEEPPEELPAGEWIDRAIGRAVEHEVLSSVPWIRRELVAESYGKDRIWIAGDAVHAMSPTGGFGMNTGIADAVDLSWKLWATLSGWGGAGLVASYEAERRPVGLRAVTTAAANVERMRAFRPEAGIIENGKVGETARALTGARVSQLMEREWVSPGIHVGYRYDDSPICVADGTESPPLPVNTYSQTARPGARAPHVALKNGHSTLDLFGDAFVVLRIGRSAPPAHRLVDALRAVGCPVTEVRLTDRAVAKAYERPLVLVRPDGHVAWRGVRVPAAAAGLALIVTGHRAADPVRASATAGVA